MKPVHCLQIAGAQVEGVCWHRKGQLASEAEGGGVSVSVGQLELGVRRNPWLSPISVAAAVEISTGSLTPIQDCGWRATLA